MSVFKLTKVFTLAAFAVFLNLSKASGLNVDVAGVSNSVKEPQAIAERGSLRSGAISTTERELQDNPFSQFLTLVTTSAGLVGGITGTLLSSVATLATSIVADIQENGFSLDTFTAISETVSAIIASTIVDIGAQVVGFVITNANGIINGFIGTLLAAVDPSPLPLSSSVTIFTEVKKCNYTYEITSAELSGTSNINFDDLAIDDFEYANNILSFKVDGEASADSLQVKYMGKIASIDNCLFKTIDYTYSTDYSNVGATIKANFVGTVENGNNLTVTTLDISDLTLTNYMDYQGSITVDDSDVTTDVVIALSDAMDTFIDGYEADATEALNDASTFLEVLDVEIPVSFELPVDIPF